MKYDANKYDVLGIGNAIVDILSYVSEDFIQKNGISKGTMGLIDEARASEIYSLIGQATEVSGGCAGNTTAAIASLGGKAAYIGRIKNDTLGKIFAHDLQNTGVFFNPKYADDGLPTAASYILVTPDAERSMLTHLGACTELDESYIDEALVKSAKVTYIEGYLYYQEKAKAAIRKALAAANESSFTLSDPFCVENNREEFKALVGDIDILFCNEPEALSLYQTKDIKDAVANFAKLGNITVITRGAKGALVVNGDFVGEVEGERVSNVLDTTGAGDLFAAGFLYGYTQGMSLPECARIGNQSAAQIIQQLGARPLKPLRDSIAA